jgi:hypothetical protein
MKSKRTLFSSAVTVLLLLGVLAGGRTVLGLLGLRGPVSEEVSPDQVPARVEPEAGPAAERGESAEKSTGDAEASPAEERAPATELLAEEPAPGEADEVLEGQVVDPAGDPIEGASLLLTRGRPSRRAPASAAARSDAEGRFRLSGLPAGSWMLSARKEGRLSVVALRQEVPARSPLVVVLSPDAPARLRVVDGQGLPLIGVRITARQKGGVGQPVSFWSVVEGVSGDDGLASLAGLTEDDESVIELTASLGSRPPVQLERKAGDLRAAVLEIVLKEGGALAGMVFDSNGDPAAGVKLVLFSAGERDRPSTRRMLHSTSTGAFFFHGLAEGRYTLFADGGERGGRRIPDLLVEEGPPRSELEVRLAPSGSLDAEAPKTAPPGIIVRPLRRGKPLEETVLAEPPGATLAPATAPRGTGSIRCRLSSKDGIPEFSIGLVPEGVPGDDPQRRYQMGRGRSEFWIPNVPPGSYRVLLIVGDQVRARAGPIAVASGKESGPVDLSLDN